MPSSFENFSLDTLSSEQKPSVKIPVDQAGQKPLFLKFQKPLFLKFTDDFEIYRSGRVEKILTGSIPDAMFDH